MKDKLLSILKERKDKKGFTLIELLVVIAIIAILVVIVVVAINPVQRLNDATDRTAASNARSAGTLISTCITQELASGGTPDLCLAGETVVASYGNMPNDVQTVIQGSVASGGSICAWQLGSGSNYFVYSSLEGEVRTDGGAPSSSTCI